MFVALGWTGARVGAALPCGTGLLFGVCGRKGSGRTTTTEGVMSWDLKERAMMDLWRKLMVSGLD